MAQSGEQKITQHISRNLCGFTGQRLGLSLYLASRIKPAWTTACWDNKLLVGSFRRLGGRVWIHMLTASKGISGRLCQSLCPEKNMGHINYFFLLSSWCFVWVNCGGFRLKFSQIIISALQKKNPKLFINCCERALWHWQHGFQNLWVSFRCLFAVEVSHFGKCHAWKLDPL